MLYLLGANHVHVDSYGLHENVRRLLKFYERRRAFTLNEVKLDSLEAAFPGESFENDTSHRSYLDLISYNDCYYRYRDEYVFVVPLDPNELIVPRNNGVASWQGVMDAIYRTEQHPYNCVSFGIGNAYFFRERNAPMDVLRQVNRSRNVAGLGYPMRSFVRADGALAIFTHHSYLSLKQDSLWCGAIDDDIALVHHYSERCPEIADDVCERNFATDLVTDETLPKKFAAKLVHAMAAVKRV